MEEEKGLIKKRNKAQRDGNLKDLKDVQKKLGDLYFDMKKYDDALEAYQGQLSAAECLNDNLNCAIAHRMIGEVNSYLGKFEDALNHINSYVIKAQIMKDPIEEQRAYATLGRTYLMKADSCVRESTNDAKDEALKDAFQAFQKSIKLCDKLENKIDKKEQVIMKARLLLNVGLVYENQKKIEDALRLIKKAETMCKEYKLKDDLHRAHLALASLYELSGDSQLALKYMDDAANVDDNFLKADAKLSKAELLLKLGEWAEARKILYSLYRTKLAEPVKSQVTRLLKIAVLICRTEDKLLLENGLANKLRLYEVMGDAAVAVKSLEKAIESYRQMLECAEKTGSRVGPALTSLSQTLRDAGKFKEAIPYALRELELCSEPKDACNSALYLAGLQFDANLPDEEIRATYRRALAFAEQLGDINLERAAIREFLQYLGKMDDVDLPEIASLNERLDNLPESQPEESEEEEPEIAEIGADIDLDELSEEENEEDPLNPTRPKFNPKSIARIFRYNVKKNDKGETALHVACIKGNVQAVEKLLEQKHPTQVHDHCGWSPLHEAANHGFVDIVRLLVKAGADVNDPGGSLCDGVTPLHDAASNGHADVVHLLLDSGANPDLLTGQGYRALDCLKRWRYDAEDLTASDLREYAIVKKRLKEVTSVECRNKDLNKRNASYNALVDADDYVTVDQRLVTAEACANSSKSKKISAGEDYKRTIASLQHPGRLQHPEQTVRRAKITAPLIDSDETLLFDNWLENDLETSNAKEKTLFGDDGMPPNQTHTAKRKLNKSDSFERETDKSTKRPKVRANSIERVPIMLDAENSNDSSASSELMIDPFQELDQWPKRKKPRQTSLLKHGIVKTSGSRPPSSAASKSPEITYIPAVIQEPRRSWESSFETVDLEVQVDRESFYLKLHTPDLSKTLGYIEKLISNKFEAKAGFKPTLRFRDKDNDTLESEMVLEAVKRDGRKLKLHGEITHIDLPPIVERYKIVCQDFNLVPSEAMLKSLRICDNTLNFRLNAEEFSDEELEPLVKCLHYQKNLRTLNLSSAMLHHSGDLLNYAICQMAHLCELHLQCCDIDYNCLSLIEKLPPELRVLDLSYNPLESKSQRKLYELIEPLNRLQTLNLRSCDLTDFQYRYSNRSLVNLDISWNNIGGAGITNFLQRQLLSLNISNTQSYVNRRNVVEIFCNDSLGFSFRNLESLDLSGVEVTDLDVENILTQLPNLLKINLSNNVDVTDISLRNMLARRPTLRNIDLSGCSLVDCAPSTALKIDNPQVCTVLVHMKLEVIDSWEALWQGKGYSKKLPTSLVLFKPL